MPKATPRRAAERDAREHELFFGYRARGASLGA